MATLVTLTVPVADLVGANFDERRASVWVVPNTEKGIVLADGIRVGGRREQVVNGVATFTGLIATNSADNPTEFAYVATITAPPKGARDRSDIVELKTAEFHLTASANLKDISEAWDEIALPPNWRSDFLDEITAQVAAAEAAAANASAISGANTADALIVALDANPASSFRTQQDTRQAAAVDTRLSDVAYVLKPSAFGGATPNRTVIQNAIDAVWNNGNGRGTVRLPDGKVIDLTIPSGGFAITARPGVTLTGNATLRVANGQPKYGSIISHNPANDVSGFALDGITIDQNKANNPAPAQTEWVGDGSDTMFALRIYRGSGITVRNCTFRNVDGVNTLVFNGVTIDTVQGVHVINNNFFEVGGTIVHDHSTIYTNAEGVLVSGNHFYGTDGATPSKSAYCAIETHGSGTRIIGNHIERYREAINATGVAIRTETLEVANNTARKVLRGVRAFALKPGSATSNLMLRGCQITNNSVILDVDWWTQTYDLEPYGITLVQETVAYSTGTKIDGNSVDVMPYSGTSTNVAKLTAGGIVVNHSGATTNTSRNLSICNNQITGALSSGIVVTGQKFNGGRIAGNVITDWGHTAIITPDYKAGVFVSNEFANLTIAGNTMVDTTAKGMRGVAWLASSASTQSRIEDNNVTLSATFGAGARDINIGSASGAPFLRHRYRTSTAAPTQACEYGSEAVFIAAGTKLTQTTAPSGTTWA